MKKISKKQLSKVVNGGWQIESVKKPKPKEIPKPSFEDMVSEGLTKSSSLAGKAIADLAENMNRLIAIQQLTVKTVDELAENMNQLIEIQQKKREVRFRVIRDKNRDMQDVVAKEL